MDILLKRVLMVKKHIYTVLKLALKLQSEN
jgi:hypothetical protein